MTKSIHLLPCRRHFQTCFSSSLFLLRLHLRLPCSSFRGHRPHPTFLPRILILLEVGTISRNSVRICFACHLYLKPPQMACCLRPHRWLIEPTLASSSWTPLQSLRESPMKQLTYHFHFLLSALVLASSEFSEDSDCFLASPPHWQLNRFAQERLEVHSAR